MDISNLSSHATDPFTSSASSDATVHIFIKKRTNTKSWTTIQGLPDNVPLKKLLKKFRKHFHCNGCIIDDDQFGQVVQLQGDHRHEAKDYIVKKGIVSEDNVDIHGN